MPRAKRGIVASESRGLQHGDTRLVDSPPVAVQQQPANQSAINMTAELIPPVDASHDARADDAITDHIDEPAPTPSAASSEAQQSDDVDDSADVALKSKGAVVLALGHDATMHANQQLPGQDWRIRLPSRECAASITTKESAGEWV